VGLYETDYSLHAPSKSYLSDEFLSVIMQFGFVTMFVPAMPLAPLFACATNVWELRMKAYKYGVGWEF